MGKRATRRKYDVFLCHNSKDKPSVEALARRLRGARLSVWLDAWEIPAGEPWQEALEEGLRRSRTVVVAIGPEGLGPWQNEEMRTALDERARDPKHRVIPVLLPDAPDAETLPTFLKRLNWVDFRAGVTDRDAFKNLVAGIKGKAPGPQGRPNVPPSKALRAYLKMVVSSARHLPLRGVDLGASDPTSTQDRLDLAQVYVDLDTRTQVEVRRARKKKPERALPNGEDDSRALKAIEAAAQNKRLVILGDPGSGKSTFLNHLCLCLAAHRLQPKGKWLSRLPDWPKAGANLVPIPVVLRDFVRWIPHNEKQAKARHLWDFIMHRLGDQKLASARDLLDQALESGNAIVLLDGLDEIPTREQRGFVRDAVAAFAQRYGESRFVVTCRTLSYQDSNWQLAHVPAVEIAPFGEEKIERFIKAWYGELARLGVVRQEEAAGLAARLEDALRRPDLWRLAPNPLLLTVMALVHTHKGRLPEARALLYEDTIEILLWRWDEIRFGSDEEGAGMQSLLREAGCAEVDLKSALWELAFHAHGRTAADEEDAVADIRESDLRMALAKLHPDEALKWADRAIEVMKLRAGLLLERTAAVYTFPHRTFQEYAAGAHLASLPDFATRAAHLAEEGALWREPILLGVGRLAYRDGDMYKPPALVVELCPERAVDEESGWRNAWLAGEVLLEAGLVRMQKSTLGQELIHRVRQRLADLLGKGRLSPVERAAAANTLAKLGDPRFQPETYYLADEPMLGFVEIPAGRFLMGSDKRKDREADDGELPQHSQDLPTYYLGRYPVTHAQYWAFVQETKHDPPAAEYDFEKPYEWLDGRPPDHLMNHPVMLVTWHDAIMYCEWLTGKLQALAKARTGGRKRRRKGEQGFWEALLDDRLRVTLPSEAEWEKAARGADGRIYPWGDQPEPDRANYDDTDISTTSAVGCFPAGASPYGAQDMSGNVWEWTRSAHGDYPYPQDEKERKEREDTAASSDRLRVLRGGSFNYADWFARCAYRFRFSPHFRYYNIGFRLCVCPHF